jgi:hypothetical protein
MNSCYTNFGYTYRQNFDIGILYKYINDGLGVSRVMVTGLKFPLPKKMAVLGNDCGSSTSWRGSTASWAIWVPDPCSFRVLDCSTNSWKTTFLRIYHAQNLSKYILTNVYNQKFLRKIWVNTVFLLFCWELFSRTDTISAVIISTCQWSLESLDPQFSGNLTSNQSKCL